MKCFWTLYPECLTKCLSTNESAGSVSLCCKWEAGDPTDEGS